MTDKTELFERKSVFRAVTELALPSVAGQIILVVYNMADTLFVGMAGSDAMITAVTVCMPAFMFLSAVSNLFGVGAASVIARALGSGEKDRVRYASSFALWGCLAVTAFYCLGAWLFCDGFVDILGGTDPAVHSAAAEYMKCAVAFGGPAAAVGTLLSHLIRAFGYSAQAGAGVVLGGVLNIALDPLFMFVILPPGRETFGAALATAISGMCALLFYIIVILIERGRLGLSAKPSADMFGNGIPGDVLKVGAAAFLMTLMENISYAVLDKLMSASGTAAQAGLGVAKKVNMLAHSIVRGIAQGVLPLIAYNYASGDRARMKKVIGCSSALAVGVSLACTAACLVFSRGLVSAFIHTGGESLYYGAGFLRILCVGAPFSAFGYTVISFFQAAGRGGRSMLLALLRKGILDIPLMFFLRARIPVYGIVAATPVTDIICCVAAAVLFCVFIRRHAEDRG